MSNDLYIPYEVSDNDHRPLPPGADFWSSPGVVLDSGPGGGAVDPSTYTPNNQQCLILVDVLDKSSAGEYVPLLFVEVWICDPATIVGPDTALPIAHGSSTKYLTGQSSSEGGSTTIKVYGFKPYPGMGSSPDGHACLIANCWGSRGSLDNPPVQSDGKSLIGSTTADFVSLVQTDGHVAQHNIFAAAMSMSKRGPRHVAFPFNAVAAVRKGEEKVVLEIRDTTGDAGLTKADLSFLRKGRYGKLPLHVSKVPLKAFAIDGGPGGAAKRVPLEIHAGHPVPLSILAEFGEGEQVGGVHAFDVIQKTTSGRAQGGVRVLAVVT
ncbi:MAG: hypothetical protein WBQ75_21360 [Acetobacteraceae bacterium]